MAKSGTSAQLEKARKELRSSLISIAPIFEEKPYFMSDEFTIVDCCVTPILWRLSAMGIDLGKSKAVKSMLNYRERLFERESVMASLSDQERELL
jgi:RNA polymerase-associated protein